MPGQERSTGQSALGVAKGANWANWIGKTAQTASTLRDPANAGMGFGNAARSSGGFLGTAGKLLAPMALATGVMGAHQGINEMMDAENGREMAGGGLRTVGGLAGTVAGGIGTVGLAGAGLTAAAGTGLLAGTAAGGMAAAGGAALAGAAAAAAPVAAVAAPIAAAIGLGFRGNTFMEEHMGTSVGGIMDGGNDAMRGLAGMMGMEEDGIGADIMGGIGTVGGAVLGGAAAVGAGVLGVGEDIYDFVTSW